MKTLARERDIEGEGRWHRLLGMLGVGKHGWQAYVAPYGLLLLGTVLLLAGPAPASNELVHLPRLRASASDSYLAGDWTFSGGFEEYFAFDSVVSPLAGVVPLELLAWAGRGFLWVALLAVLMWIGSILGLRPWPAALAIGTWLGIGQSTFNALGILGGFQPNQVAWLALLLALAMALRGRIPWAVALAGLSITLHPAVGLLGSLALGPAILAVPAHRRPAVRWAWVGALLAMPGLLGLLGSDSAGSTEDWRFLVQERIPHHADFWSFSAGDVVTTVLMAGFSLAFWLSRGRGPKSRLLIAFQIALLVQLAIGMVFALANWFPGLGAQPFRLFSTLTLLMFLLNAFCLGAELLEQRSTASLRHRPELLALGGLAVAGLLIFANPAYQGAKQLWGAYLGWTRPATEMQQAFIWAGENLPASSVGLLPPEAKDGHYLTGLPRVVSWKAIRYDDLAEWRTRIEAVTGGGEIDYEVGSLNAAFQALTEEQIGQIIDRYGATYLVSPSAYSYRVLHTVGEYHIYELSGG